MRRRVWCIFLRGDMAFGASSDDIDGMATDALHRLRHTKKYTMMSIDSFLLDETHPRVIDNTQHAPKETRLDGSVSRARHAAAASCSSSWSDSLLATYPGFRRLCERHRLMLDSKHFQFPTPHARVTNLSQASTSDGHDVAPTITPSGFFYLGHRVRVLIGDESLGLQFIYLEPSRAAAYLQRFLQNLAGNSFCAADCAATFVVALEVIVRLFARSQAVTCSPTLPFVLDMSGPECAITKQSRSLRSSAIREQCGSDSDSDEDWSRRRKRRV